MTQHSIRRRTFTAQLLTFVAGSSLGINLFAKANTKSAELVLLAKNAPAGIDPAGYLISEKLDGVRALWDGKQLRFRSGKAIAAPQWFTDKLPKTALDGELWLVRGAFDKLSGIVRKPQAIDSVGQRAALNSIADSAALAATEGIKSEYIYTQGLDQEARIDAEAAADYAQSYLAQSGAQASYPGLRAHISAEGNVVRVRLSAPMNLRIPVPGVVGSDDEA